MLLNLASDGLKVMGRPVQDERLGGLHLGSTLDVLRSGSWMCQPAPVTSHFIALYARVLAHRCEPPRLAWEMEAVVRVSPDVRNQTACSSAPGSDSLEKGQELLSHRLKAKAGANPRRLAVPWLNSAQGGIRWVGARLVGMLYL